MVQGAGSIVKEMKEIYSTVDLRVAAIRKDAKHEWQNLLTVIRYSYLSKDEIIKHYKMLGTSKAARSDKFMIKYTALDVEDPLLAQHGKNYIFCVDEEIIYYWDLVEPDKMEFYFSEFPEFYCDSWGAFQGSTIERIDNTYSGDYKFLTNLSDYQKIVYDEKVDAMRLGFADIRSAIVHYLSARNMMSSIEPRIYLVLPIYAKLNRPYYTNGNVCVNIDRHSKLSKLQVNYLRGLFHQGYFTVDLARATPRTFELQTKDGSGRIIDETITLEHYRPDIIEKMPDDEISISLVYLGLGGITIDSERHEKIRNLVAASVPYVINSLHGSFEIFCSSDEFKRMLLEPHGFRSTGKEGELKLSKQTVFERAITWLLELGGYRAVWLAEKERWQESSGFEHGSADILAFNPTTRCLYVIGCSLKPPEHDEILDIARTGGKIYTKLFGDSKDVIQIFSVYFYAAKEDKEITTLGSRNNVIAISIEGIEYLYDELKSKQAIPDLRALERIVPRGEPL